MPYQAANFYQGQPKYEIVREGLPFLVERIDVTGIRSIDEENVQGFCDYNNNQSRREELKKEIEFRKTMPEPKIIIVSR
ncbi:MAG: hypothetical protein AAB866_01805 [Patescibacteria group bacterium]